MSALLLITAASAPSKVPFFIIGGALAVYAVILARSAFSARTSPPTRGASAE